MPKYTPQKIPAKWRDLLLLIPGYDCISTAPADHWFDSEAAQRAIDFFQECLRHIEGEGVAGELFILERWQQAIIACIFGWQRKDAKGRTVRRYREVLVFLPRGNGKTTLIAGLCVYMLICDGEPGAQIYGAAAEREQAALLFRQAKGMIEQEPELSNRCKIFGGMGHRSITLRDDPNSSYRVLSADAFSKHGFNTHAAFIDELHALPNRDLVDVLKTSMGKANRKQPLMVYLTTSDFDRPSICNEKHDYAEKVRHGVVDDPEFLPVIYQADREDDWKDEKVWAKANPNLGVSVDLERLRSECKQAQEIPSYENTFRRLKLNQRTTTNEKCIPLDQWDACRREVVVADLDGRECYAGLDIGSMSDFTAFVLLFPHADSETVEVPLAQGEKPVAPTDGDAPAVRTIMRRTYTMLPFFWLPEEPVKRDSRMMVQIDAWRKQGFIRTTPGDVVDYEQVLFDILEIIAPYYLVGVNFDRGFQGVQTGTNLIAHLGEDRVKYFSQGILSMAPPFREFLELLAAGRIHHDGNPVMRWMAANTVGERRGGLMKPSKEKSAEKIDAITGACMGLAWAMSAPTVDWYVPGQGL